MAQPNCPLHRPPPLAPGATGTHAMPMPTHAPMHVPMPTPMPTPAKTFEAMRSTVSAEQQHAQSDSPHGISAHVTPVLLTGM
jgi:hypothetical protein